MIPSVRSRSLCSSMQSAARRISSASFSSILRFKRGSVERSDAVVRSKRCFAASVPAESFKEKRHNRITRQERREMLEAFVDRYRALNDGKFPTVSLAKKEVGGSFYVVREIIQELAYSHKTSHWKPEKPTESGERTAISADTDDSPDVKDGVAVGSFEVEVPLISSDPQKTLTEVSASCSTIEVMHSSKQIVVGTENSVMNRKISAEEVLNDGEDLKKDSPLKLAKESGKDAVSKPSKILTIDIEVNEKNSPLVLANENGEYTVHDPIKYQNRLTDASVPLRLENEADILIKPVIDVRGTIEDESSSTCAEEEVKKRNKEEISAQGITEEKSFTVCAEEGVKDRSNVEVSKYEKLTSDGSRTLEDASQPKGSSIWGNLISLANEFISFWRKK